MRPYEMTPGAQGAEAVLEAAVEVRRAAWLAASGHAGLDAVIDGLSAVFPYDELLLSRWNPDAQEHVNVISSAAASAADFIQFEQHRDPLVAHMRQTRQTLWLSRLTAEQRHGSTTVQKVITPLGFAEGTTQCLYSTEGHYVGVLNVGTRSPADTLGPARHALTLLFDALAATLTTHTPGLGTPTGRTQGWEATIADDTNFCTVSAIEPPSRRWVITRRGGDDPPPSDQLARCSTSDPVLRWLLDRAVEDERRAASTPFVGITAGTPPPPEVRGASPSVRCLVDRATIRDAVAQATSHEEDNVINNHVAVMEGDDATAETYAYIGAPWHEGATRFVDRLVREGDAWRVVDRSVTDNWLR